MASICSYIWMLSHPEVTLFINIRRIRRVALVGVCVAFIDLTSEIVSQLPIKCFVPGCQTWPPIPLPAEASHWSLDDISGFVTYEGMTKGRINCNREILHKIWIYTCFYCNKLNSLFWDMDRQTLVDLWRLGGPIWLWSRDGSFEVLWSCVDFPWSHHLKFLTLLHTGVNHCPEPCSHLLLSEKDPAPLLWIHLLVSP